MQPNPAAKVVELNAQQILHCVSNIVSNQMVQESHEFLARCEKNHLLAALLLDIFEGIDTSPQLQEAVFLLAVNVIKRNWQANRRSFNTSTSSLSVAGIDSQKPFLKARILKYCVERPAFLKWAYLKDLLGYISYIEYPHNWPELQAYMLTILARIYEAPALTLRTLEDMELILKVLKCEAKKSSIAKKNIFATYIIHILKPIEAIAQILDGKLQGSTIDTLSLGELKLSCILDRCRLSCLKTIDNECLKEYLLG